MVDYAIDSDFDIYFTPWSDFATVDGREEFEQNLVVAIHDAHGDVIGDVGITDTTREEIRMTATRIAREFDAIEEVESFRISRPTEESGTVEVEVTYLTGETFSETF